ncbi:MAG: heavy-metal-associated domain-containing protein [Syntrophomonadaceae bacterium]|nr:heavy-metal-associated domain-containing protein [Syntrophomonadaceae bacterium]
MGDTVLKIEGMTCNHCKMAVEKALKGVPGVDDVKVDLAKKEAVVTGSPEWAAMVKAVNEAGYKVTE